MAKILVAILLGIGTPSEAFHLPSLPRKIPLAHQRTMQSMDTKTIACPSALHMSDVPQDDDKKKTKKTNSRRYNHLSIDRWWQPPPAPEDQFIMIGDLLSLTVYGISDHLVCQIMSHQMVPSDAHQLVTDMIVNERAALHAPVWWEAGSPQAGSILQTTLEAHVVTHYSPLLEPMGQATTLLAGAWLLAGWLHRAFLYQNTLDCPTDKALTVTGRTWLTTCLILFGLVITCNACVGMEDWATTFRQGDVDYVVDSLTVLIVWRYIASIMLGGGSK